MMADARQFSGRGELDQSRGQVFVRRSALGTGRQKFFRVGFEVERADPAANPVPVALGHLAAAGDLIADPHKNDPGEKNEEGGENQPRELHPDHGMVDGRTSEPHWNSTNPQSGTFFCEGEN